MIWPRTIQLAPDRRADRLSETLPQIASSSMPALPFLRTCPAASPVPLGPDLRILKRAPQELSTFLYLSLLFSTFLYPILLYHALLPACRRLRPELPIPGLAATRRLHAAFALSISAG